MLTPIALKQALFKAAPPPSNNGAPLPTPPAALLQKFKGLGVDHTDLDSTKTPWTFDSTDPVTVLTVDKEGTEAQKNIHVQLNADETAGSPNSVEEIMKNTFAQPWKDAKGNVLGTQYIMNGKGGKPIMFNAPKGKTLLLGHPVESGFAPVKVLLDGKVSNWKTSTDDATRSLTPRRG